MAERAGKGKQLPKRQRPSRLRNEVRQGSTDDEREHKKHAIQVPNSDAVVPETQPDHDEYFNDDVHGPENESEFTLSPNSLALRERTAVTKKAEAVEFIPFTFKPLSRSAFPLSNSSASAGPHPSVPRFKTTKKVPKKPSRKEEDNAEESITHNALTIPDDQEHSVHASHGEKACHSRPSWLTYE
jgi:hypothetical protein